MQGPGEELRVDSGLEDTMVNAYWQIREKCGSLGKECDLKTAAYVHAIDKVATSYAVRGIFP